MAKSDKIVGLWRMWEFRAGMQCVVDLCRAGANIEHLAELTGLDTAQRSSPRYQKHLASLRLAMNTPPANNLEHSPGAVGPHLPAQRPGTK